MMSGAPDWKDGLWSSLQTARLSSRHPGTDLASARNDFWGCRRLALHRFVTKSSHVGADVEWLAYRLRCPMNCG
jgi:hypothetical protein